jgi:hypothetical protein
MNLLSDTIEKPMAALNAFLEHHKGPYFVCYEVFGIRASYTNNKWSYSTKRKSNAFESFWAERKSFGDLFKEEVSNLCDFQIFEESLKKDMDYYFLVPLRHQNRVLLSFEKEQEVKPIVYLSAVYDKTNDKIVILTSETSHDYEGVWSFLPEVNPTEYNSEKFPNSIGVTYSSIEKCTHVELPNPKMNVIRFLAEEFAYYRQLRDNMSNIYIRYGQLWLKRSPDLNAFREHYKNIIIPFDNAIDEIYGIYNKRYELREHVQTTPFKHAILKKVRELQLKKKWKSMSKNNIYSVIFKHFSTKLYKVN